MAFLKVCIRIFFNPIQVFQFLEGIILCPWWIPSDQCIQYQDYILFPSTVVLQCKGDATLYDTFLTVSCGQCVYTVYL